MLSITNAGGGASLAFRVVKGTSAPSSPQENTIWINTSVNIPAWYVGNEVPASPANGTVLIQTGSVSSAPMLAVRGKNITLYPISALQYVSGVWVPVAAATYQSGAWVPWTTYLFRDGDTCDSLTGGWASYAMVMNTSVFPASQGGAQLTVTEITNGVRLTQSNTNYGGIYSAVNKIDLTEFSSIKFTGKTYRDSVVQNPMYFVVASSYGQFMTDNAALVKTFPVGTVDYNNEVIADVSNLSGEYYLYFGVYSNEGKYIDLNRLSLER